MFLALFNSCQDSIKENNLEYTFDKFECYLYDYESELTYSPKEFNTGGFDVFIVNNTDSTYHISDINNIKLLDADNNLSIYSLELIKTNQNKIINENFEISKNDTLKMYFAFKNLYLDNFIEYEKFIEKIFFKSDSYSFYFDAKINNKINRIEFKIFNNKSMVFYKNNIITNKFTKTKTMSPQSRAPLVHESFRVPTK